MTEREIKYNLNKPVMFRDSEYILTGAIIRLGEKGYFYQAELTDMKQRRSVVIARLIEVKIKESDENDV